jgi:hypothetical protein
MLQDVKQLANLGVANYSPRVGYGPLKLQFDPRFLSITNNNAFY